MNIELHGMDKVLKSLSPESYKKAVRRTISETKRSARAATAKALRAEYTAKASKLKEYIDVRFDGDVITIVLRKKPIGLKHYQHKVGDIHITDGGKKILRDISVRIKRPGAGGGYKKIRTAFAVDGKGGGNFFSRELKYRRGASKAQKRIMRNKLTKLVGPSVADMAKDNRNIEKLLNEAVVQKMAERFQRNFEFYIRRAK